MRKYIYKFKNYTSVEVDNLHDLKEGDLALYEGEKLPVYKHFKASHKSI